MYDPILTLNFVRCFRDKLPWWLLAQDELLAATITKLVCWVRLTEAELWARQSDLCSGYSALHFKRTCFISKGTLISGTCCLMYTSSEAKSMGCRTAPAMLEWEI